MDLKSPKSRTSIINLFSDYILKSIPSDEDSVIQVADCGNFYVVKGITSYNVPLDISKLSDEFCEKFSSHLENKKALNTIDLLEYDKKVITKEIYTFTLFNNDNCFYSTKEESADKSELIVVSEFPHGYSLNQGRLLYYYTKHIVYNIPSNYPFSGLRFEVPTDKEKLESDFKVFNLHTEEYDENLKSSILDVFNFDTSVISNEIKKVDCYVEVTNPLDEYSFLKERVKDFIII
jgi:hypothetical protein